MLYSDKIKDRTSPDALMSARELGILGSVLGSVAGAAVSGLMGGRGGSGGGSTSQVMFDPAVQGMLPDIVQRGRDWAGTPFIANPAMEDSRRYLYETVYSPELFDLYGDTAANVGGLAGLLESRLGEGPGGYLGVGTQEGTTGAIQARMSPYERIVRDNVMREAQEQADIEAAQDRAAAAANRAGFGDRSAIAMELGRNKRQRRLDDLRAGLAERGFESARRGFEADMGRGLQAAMANQRAYGDSITRDAATEANRIQLLRNLYMDQPDIGLRMRGLGLQNAELLKGAGAEERDWPLKQIDVLGNIVNLGKTGTQYNRIEPDRRLQNAIGGGLAGWSLGRQAMDWWNAQPSAPTSGGYEWYPSADNSGGYGDFTYANGGLAGYADGGEVDLGEDEYFFDDGGTEEIGGEMSAVDLEGVDPAAIQAAVGAPQISMSDAERRYIEMLERAAQENPAREGEYRALEARLLESMKPPSPVDIPLTLGLGLLRSQAPNLGAAIGEAGTGLQSEMERVRRETNQTEFAKARAALDALGRREGREDKRQGATLRAGATAAQIESRIAGLNAQLRDRNLTREQQAAIQRERNALQVQLQNMRGDADTHRQDQITDRQLQVEEQRTQRKILEIEGRLQNTQLAGDVRAALERQLAEAKERLFDLGTSRAVTIQGMRGEQAAERDAARGGGRGGRGSEAVQMMNILDDPEANDERKAFARARLARLGGELSDSERRRTAETVVQRSMRDNPPRGIRAGTPEWDAEFRRRFDASIQNMAPTQRAPAPAPAAAPAQTPATAAASPAALPSRPSGVPANARFSPSQNTWWWQGTDGSWNRRSAE